MARKKDRKKKGSVTLDFTGVESNFMPPEGDYRLKVVSVNHKDNDGDGAFVWKFEITGADSKKLVGKTFTNYTNLGENSLWVLRNLLEALGVEIPEGPFDIDTEELVGLEVEASVEHRDWEGKTKLNLGNFVAVDGESSEAEEDEEEVEITDKKKSKRSRDEDEEEGDEDEDEEPRKKSKKSRKKDEEEDEESDEDEEEEKPRKGKKSRKSDDDEEEDEDEEKPRKKSKKSKDEDEEEESEQYEESDIQDMSEKELKKLIKKHDLDVDLEDHSSQRKKVMAVVDALEENGLLAG